VSRHVRFQEPSDRRLNNRCGDALRSFVRRAETDWTGLNRTVHLDVPIGQNRFGNGRHPRLFTFAVCSSDGTQRPFPNGHALLRAALRVLAP
jgi:hypothetical protein